MGATVLSTSSSVSGPLLCHMLHRATLYLKNISWGNKSVDVFKDLIRRMFLARFILWILIRHLLSARCRRKMLICVKNEKQLTSPKGVDCWNKSQGICRMQHYGATRRVAEWFRVWSSGHGTGLESSRHQSLSQASYFSPSLVWFIDTVENSHTYLVW